MTIGAVRPSKRRGATRAATPATARARPARASRRPSQQAPRQGLALWIEEVVALHARALRGLRVEVVHDLRVAIRRCRSLAQGLRAIDDDEGAALWRGLSDAGRPLFQGLGELRDAQVMREHAVELLQDDAALPLVLSALDGRIRLLKDGAREAVRAFEPAAWRAASDRLPARAAALLEEQLLFDHLVLRRFFEAKELHQAAMRSRSSVALHALRIGIKKLRYTVENFLPEAHTRVGKLLKKLQEVLGDLHDHDVLIAFLGSEHVRLHSEDRSRVCQLVRAARDGKVAAYRALALGGEESTGAWIRLRGALADGTRVPLAHRALMLKKAAGRGVDWAAVRGVERSALVLVHALAHRLPALRDARVPALARFAAACVLVEGGGKPARRFASRLPLAVGFSARDRAMLEVLAGAFGAAPSPTDARTQALVERDRRVVVALGAVLHLAVRVREAGPFVVRDTGELLLLDLSRPLRDAADFAVRRAPLEGLVGKPLWWRTRVP
jgi:CHAD domain-containing protein